MKTLLFLIAVAFGTVVAVRRFVPTERREELRETLIQVPATVMEACMDAMPDDSPPKVMVSAMRRFEDQNDELVSLLREQNKLLRKQNAILEEAASAAESEG